MAFGEYVGRESPCLRVFNRPAPSRCWACTGENMSLHILKITALAVASFLLASPVSAQVPLDPSRVSKGFDLTFARQLVDHVRSSGYQCREVINVRQCLVSTCAIVFCDNRWTYEIAPNARGGVSITVN